MRRDDPDSGTPHCLIAYRFQVRFSFARPAENPRRYWAGWQFRISRGWLHHDLQGLQDLFLLGCWEAILIEFSAIDRDAIARDLR